MDTNKDCLVEMQTQKNQQSTILHSGVTPPPPIQLVIFYLHVILYCTIVITHLCENFYCRQNLQKGNEQIHRILSLSSYTNKNENYFLIKSQIHSACTQQNRTSLNSLYPIPNLTKKKFSFLSATPWFSGRTGYVTRRCKMVIHSLAFYLFYYITFYAI